MRARFSKGAKLRFISHLDLIRLFHRALRRAGLPATITKGFSPHIKMSITKALKLGIESENEEAIFYLSEKFSPQEFARRLNVKLPDGVRIVRVEEMK